MIQQFLAGRGDCDPRNVNLGAGSVQCPATAESSGLVPATSDFLISNLSDSWREIVEWLHYCVSFADSSKSSEQPDGHHVLKTVVSYISVEFT